MAGDGYGDMYDEGPSNEVPMTRLQIFMSRSLAGWPLYTIIIALGQLLSAVSVWSNLLSCSNDMCSE